MPAKKNMPRQDLEGFSRVDNATVRTTILGEAANTQISLSQITVAGPSGIVVTYCEKCYQDTETGHKVCEKIPCPDSAGSPGDEGSFESPTG